MGAAAVHAVRLEHLPKSPGKEVVAVYTCILLLPELWVHLYPPPPQPPQPPSGSSSLTEQQSLNPGSLGSGMTRAQRFVEMEIYSRC